LPGNCVKQRSGEIDRAMILLDTDIMIDVLRKYPPAMAWLASLGSTALMLPGFVQKHYAAIVALTTVQPYTKTPP
jgi:hypothetical protein